jgi:hypothetical protein
VAGVAAWYSNKGRKRRKPTTETVVAEQAS